MAAIKAKCKFPQPCVVLALGRVRGLVAGTGRREGQTSPFDMPGACLACLGPCAGRKWVVSSASALVSVHQPLCVPKARGHQGRAFYPTVTLFQANCPNKCFLTPKTAIPGDLLHHAGGKHHISTSPSYRSTYLLSPLCLFLRTQGSRFSAVHAILWSIRNPRWLQSLLSACNHSEASCELLALWSD